MNYQGRWALVTGASAGIGAAFARSLAAKGANVILVARRREKMEELASELEREHAVETRVIAADLAKPEAPEEIHRALSTEGIAVDILINNAGFGLPGVFVDSPWQAHRDFIELMVTSYAHLARLFLPGMIERGYGRIVQVASLAGLVPASAGHTLYAPSKSFLIFFSQALAAECEGTGVNVSALCPGFTYSEFHDANNTRGLVSQLPKYMFMQAEPVVEGALRAVEDGYDRYVPGAWNNFVAWLVKALPRPMAVAMTRRQSARYRKKSV